MNREEEEEEEEAEEGKKKKIMKDWKGILTHSWLGHFIHEN